MNIAIGLEDVQGIGGNDPLRFNFVDGSSESREFFEHFSIFPWEFGEPDDFTGDQHCVV